MILKTARKLKDTGYYINEDFSKETIEIRKENWKKVKEPWKNDKYAILVCDKVFWREEIFRKDSLSLFWCFERIFVCEEFSTLRKMNFDVENENFENILANPFDSQNNLSDENNDPDINFFNEKYEAVNSPYYNVYKFNSSSQNFLKISFSVLHINIRSMNKNFEKLREYLSHVKGNFSIIALTETWYSDDKSDKNSLWQLLNYTAIYQIRNSSWKRGGIALHVYNSLNYKIPKSKNINNNDIECWNIEIVSKASKNVIISCIYRLPRGDAHKFLYEMKGHIIKNKFQEKPLFLVGDLNINSLDYSRNTHVRDFFNFVFENGKSSVINRPTRVTKSSATIIDHILTNT